MDLLNALLLGFVQGITEFLPISSSAHLILTSKLFGWADQGLNFDMAVHFGSLIAVVIYFKEQVKQVILGMLDFTCNKKTANADLFKKIVVATLPIVIFGFFMKEFVETTLRDCILIIAITSIVWGILLYFADKQPEDLKDDKKIGYKAALLMGVAQALAIIPGTSRSGSTMTVARFLKFSRIKSAEFSMLMSVPVISLMMVANIYDIYKQSENVVFNYQFLTVGTISSCVFALLGIHLLMKLVNKVGFLPFVIYRIALGVIILAVVI